jgi:hypothetical protein
MLTVWTPVASSDPFDEDMLIELVRRPLRYYADALGVRYPYPKCDLVFVPRFSPLAFSPPGLATLQDQLLKPSENRACPLLMQTVGRRRRQSPARAFRNVPRSEAPLGGRHRARRDRGQVGDDVGERPAGIQLMRAALPEERLDPG